MAIFLRNGVNQEHFIPQMHLLLRKTPLIMWLSWKNKPKAPQTATAVLCSPFGVFPLCIHPSLSFSRFISSACLPRVYLIFWSHFSPSPCRCFPSSITPRLFSFFPRVYFQKMESKSKMETLRRWPWCWLSFVFLICFISIRRWEELWGNAKTMHIQ